MNPHSSRSALAAALLALATIPAAVHAQADSTFAVSRAGVTLLRLDGDGGFTVKGSAGTGAVPTSGGGVRAMWYPGKWAFRAGQVTSSGANNWDDASIGTGSAAFGQNSLASGNASFAANLSTTASGEASSAFGSGSTASGQASFGVNGSAIGSGAVALGRGSQATGDDAVALGPSSIAGGLGSFVAGPSNASGNFSIAMGLQNSASGYYSVAIGRNARTAARQGTIVLGDACGISTADSVYPTANNQFVVRGCGGIKLYTARTLNAGVEVAAGGGSWITISDRNRKENFLAVDGEDVLARLRRVPVTSWNYRTQDRSIRHLGPMAQDMTAAFGLGENPLGINTVDIDGVNMAGVQALAARTDTLRAQAAILAADNQALRTRVSDLEARLARLEAAVAAAPRSPVTGP